MSVNNWTIRNASQVPLNVDTGTVPDMSGALEDWFQPMVFQRVVKTVVGYELVESQTPTKFRGVIQPFTARQLLLKPEGQRAWSWFTLHTDTVLTLNVDDIIVLRFSGKQTRIMARKDYGLYGFVEYDLVQDWTGANPAPPAVTDIDGGTAYTAAFDNVLDGGNAEVTGPNAIDGGDAIAN